MDDAVERNYLESLENGEIHYFREWSKSLVPKICCGVYTIWRDEQLIYVGVSGRSLNSESIEEHKSKGTKTIGLFTRLRDHASGVRSGDQFCVYVADLLVLPTLTEEQIKLIASGELRFDKLNRDYIHANLIYRFVEVENYAIALVLENDIKKGVLKAGKPLLNPAR